MVVLHDQLKRTMLQERDAALLRVKAQGTAQYDASVRVLKEELAQETGAVERGQMLALAFIVPTDHDGSRRVWMYRRFQKTKSFA